MSKRLNSIYYDMKRRCYDSSNIDFKFYGARGITVCKEWLDSEMFDKRSSKGWLAFKEWALSNGYKEGLSIDRIDVNKGYSPENCRWITMKEQNNNRRNNHLITYKGKTQTMKQWSEELNIPYFCLSKRLSKLHLSIEEAFMPSDRRFKGGKECQR